MSSIEIEPDELLISFFNREFARTMKSLAEQNIQLLVSAPDDSCSTYYIQREKRHLERKDFELDLTDEEKLLSLLQQRWSGPEAELLTDLFRKILSLSAHYSEETSSHNVTPYIYAMF